MEKFCEDHDLNEKQIRGVQKLISGLVDNALSQYVVPISKNAGKEQAKQILGKSSDSLMLQVEKIMQTYPANIQSNPEAWKNTAHYIRSINLDSWQKSNSSNPKSDNSNIRSVHMTNGGLNPANPTSQSDNKTPSLDKYSQDEQTVIKLYHGGDPADYEKYKSKKSISQVTKDTKPIFK